MKEIEEINTTNKAHMLIQLLSITYPHRYKDGTVEQLSILEEEEQTKAKNELFKLLGI